MPPLTLRVFAGRIYGAAVQAIVSGRERIQSGCISAKKTVFVIRWMDVGKLVPLMNTKPLALWVQALFSARQDTVKNLCVLSSYFFLRLRHLPGPMENS